MATLTVGCKLPHGLLLEVDGKKVKVAGANQARIAGGFGMTENVDAEFFAKWMEDNKRLKFVQNGLIFGFDKPDEVKAFAQLSEGVSTGFEKLDPEAMPALLEPTDEQKKALAVKERKSGDSKSSGSKRK